MKDEIKVSSQLRKDDRVTVTIKLIGWEPRNLTSLRYAQLSWRRIAERVNASVTRLFVDQFNEAYDKEVP